MKTLGIDIGSSSIKVSLMDVVTGECVASQTMPAAEMPIRAERSGWAEQDPDMWWKYVCDAIRKIGADHPMKEVAAIGITYQMHGLVCVDELGKPLRDAIIWCDSRAVEIGRKALEALGRDYCLERTLNSPGNFTASKFAWVRENEPEVFARTYKFMLPGDYVAMRLTGRISTTEGGLSEQILWDFSRMGRADFVAEYYGIPTDRIPEALPGIGIQCRTNAATESILGIPEGTPVSYRAGDQPNNAFSLGVLHPGEIAATAGTSGVVYGVIAEARADRQSRVGTFLHVNNRADAPRLGVLLCINGTGILNAWVKRVVAPELSYDEVNRLCETIPAGSDGVVVLPFGNGAERMLEDRFTGAEFAGIDLNRHGRGHLLRAAQEGIAYAFRYGVDIMRTLGLNPSVIRAGQANMFLSPLFRSTLATLCNASIQLYNTDGSLGAARGAALGAGLYRDDTEAFASLRMLSCTEPQPAVRDALEESYGRWKNELESKLNG